MVERPGGQGHPVQLLSRRRQQGGVAMTEVAGRVGGQEVQVLGAVDNLLATLRANPAIKSAEATDLPVISLGDQDIAAVPVGEPDNTQLPPSLWIRSVTPGYLQAMHMRLVAGRQLTAQDVPATGNVGILNEYAAERYFPGEDFGTEPPTPLRSAPRYCVES